MFDKGDTSQTESQDAHVRAVENSESSAEHVGLQSSSLHELEGTPAAGLTISSEPGLNSQAAETSRRSMQPIPVVNVELLLKAVAKQGHRIPDNSDAQHKLLGKLTHLHINGLHLHELPSLRLCSRLQVLYLYDNQLKSISNIASNRLLTHLYLHNNQLQQLAGLQDLALLQKLYLQNNCLAAIDHLSAATRLEELHVSGQRPQQQQQQQQDSVGCRCDPVTAASTTQQAAADTTGRVVSGLQFNFESLQAMSGSLRVLAAANCGITDISQLAVLRNLQTLDLSDNNISRLNSLQPILQALRQLRVLNIRHNPCLHHEPKYRDYVILLASDTLLTLDGEDIPATHRAFLLGLHLNKLRAQGKVRQQQQGHSGPGQQLVGKCLDCCAMPAVVAASDGKSLAGPSVGLSGTGMTLHVLKAPAVRPTAAGGFNASSARVAAVLAAPEHPGGSGHPCHGQQL